MNGREGRGGGWAEEPGEAGAARRPGPLNGASQ
ncbi:MAG: hypothetical protein JWN52_2070 [Actinomycetia bacterium]|jgi:hypothetical protein|nr:hypothetical protein [Actinomycetes bacterium]